MRDILNIFTVALIFSFLFTSPIYADWSLDPRQNNPVDTSARSQYDMRSISDGEGGLFIVWKDNQPDQPGMYAQRVDGEGSFLWQDGGVLVSSVDRIYNINLLPDGSGGVIILWRDRRGYPSPVNLYGQRLDREGNLLWPADGMPIIVHNADKAGLEAVSDNAGGAFLVWQDYRDGNWNVFAHHINEDGGDLWTENGVAVTALNSDQSGPQIVNDGSGGIIVAWTDDRDDVYDLDVYGQRLDADGEIMWTENGQAIVNASEAQSLVEMVTDRNGGAIVAFDYDDYLYTSRVNSSGNLVFEWTGVRYEADIVQLDGRMISDGTGGAVLTWSDGLFGGPYDLYAQRIDSYGHVLWGNNALTVCTSTENQVSPQLSMLGDGSVAIIWEDARNTGGVGYDLYAHRILPSGEKLWSYNGMPVSLAPETQDDVQIVTHQRHFIAVWIDERNDVSGRYSDIYMQMVDKYGNLGMGAPELISVADVPGDQGGKVSVKWKRSAFDREPDGQVVQYAVWRGVNDISDLSSGISAAKITHSVLNRENNAIYVDAAFGDTIYWEWLETLPAHREDGYSYTANTLADSTSHGAQTVYFMVSANSWNEQTFWDSNIDSGYSVDNLAPAAPRAFEGTVSDGTLNLHWEPGTEPDLSHYNLYRSTAANFNPESLSPWVIVSDTFYVTDDISTDWYYAVVAEDIHENLSAKSDEFNLTSVDISEGEQSLPDDFALYENFPDPFNPSTTIKYDLPRGAHVTLDVYNTAGQRIETLVDEYRSAGSYTELFEGAELSSGLYFYRIRAGDFTKVRKMVLTR